jgi:RHS repeat-associated protein
MWRLALAVSTLSVGSAWAAGDVNDQFFRFAEVKNKSLEPHLPGERVDTFSGTLTIVQTDVSLPGKAGHDLNIVRTYSSKVWGRADALDLEPLLADKEPTPVGFGWNMHLGRIRNPYATAQNLPCGQADLPIYEGPAGDARVFYPVTQSTNTEFISKDFWKLQKNCTLTTGETGICVTDTAGRVHEFSSTFQFDIGGRPIWPAKGIVDVFGNRITATYASGRLATITDTLLREVTFAYSTCGARQCLQSMTISSGSASRVYTYGYTIYTGTGTAIPLPSPGRAFLTSMNPPTAPGYSYTYLTNETLDHNLYALGSITYPFGGTTTYTYAGATFFTGNESVPFSVVKTRETTAPSLPGGITHYSYASPTTGPDAGFVICTVTRPDAAVDEYRHFGFGGTTAQGSIWRVGLLRKVSRGNGAEVEENDWSSGGTVAPGSKFAAPAYGATCPNSLWDLDVFAPVLSKRTITRGSSRYELTLSAHNAFGEPTSIDEVGEAQRSGAKPVRKTTRAYDVQPTTNQVLGRISSEKVCAGTSTTDCALTTRQFTQVGNSLSSETAKGVKTDFTYNMDGTLLTLKNAENKTLTLTLYSFGIPRSINFNGAFTTTRVVNWDGTLESETDGRGKTTSYTYDASGRLSTITKPGTPTPDVITYEYSATGDWTSVRRGTETGGFRQKRLLDGIGREISTIIGDSATNGNVSAIHTRTFTTYDSMGRVAFASYPSAASGVVYGEGTAYDFLGRATTVSHRIQQGSAPCTLAGGCSQTTFSYGAADHCVTTTLTRAASDVLTTKSCYESFGSPSETRLVSVRDAANGNSTFTYDIVGNIKTFGAPLAKGNRSFSYSPNTFFLKTETSGPRGSMTVNTVNALGQPLTVTDGRGQLKTLTYNDPLSRLDSVSYAGSPAEKVNRTYDKETLKTVSSPAGGSYTYNYDDQGRLSSQIWTFNSVPYTTSWHYDAAGCLDSMTYPTGSVVTMTCDRAARTKTVSLGASSLVTNTTYLPTGKPNVVSYANGTTVTTSMDKGRVSSISTPNVMGLTYGYDGANNVVTITDAVSPTESATLTYDKLDRLNTATLATTPSTSLGYSYDALGNRTSKTGSAIQPTTYTYDANNRLDSSTGPSAPAAMTLTWNSAEMLSASSDGATYVYDGNGRRVRKTASGIDVVYHYDSSGRLLSETTATGSRIRDYIYVGDQLAVVDGCVSGFTVGCGQREWLHTDLVGTVVARTNAAGAVTAQLNYHPWGEANSAQSGALLFNGRSFDSGTGFFDFGARVYSPELGRFLSADTVWAQRAFSQSSNQYAFTLNNPYKFTDPSGSIPFFVVTGIAGAIVGGVTGAALAAYVSYDSQTGVNWAAVGHGAVAGTIAGGIIGLTAGYATATAAAGSGTAEFGAVAKGIVPWVTGVGGAGAKVATDNQEQIKTGLNTAVQTALAPRAPEVLNVSTRGFGNFAQGRLDATSALNSALQWLGNGYRQMGPGVYRSLDGFRQFRMTNSDLAGGHNPNLPHVHFEALNQLGQVIENNHVLLIP